MRPPRIVCLILAVAAAMGGGMIGPASCGAPDDDRLATVRRAVEPALANELATAGLKLGAPVFLRLFKESNELEVWMESGEDGRYVRFRVYPVATWGAGSLGPKLKEGDGQAPEGFYAVARAQLNPRSRFHLAIDLGFPNAFDRAHGRTGSHLMVHGGEKSIGCYAMTDRGIESIYLLVEAALRAGQPAVSVHIFPFRMSSERLDRAAGSEWIGFWRNLKVGFDAFERNRRPPTAGVSDRRYVFE